MKERNSSIDIVKFVIALHIVLLHSAMVFQYDLFQNGYIFVEWFYIFSGFMVARRIANSDNKLDTFLTSCSIIRDRIVNIYPYYFLSCTIALLMKLKIGLFAITKAWTVHRIIFEYLMLYATTLIPLNLTDVSWFLSAMWIAFIILVPLGVKFKHNFFRFSIFIFLIIYYYIYISTGHIWGPDEWTPFGYKGLLRAIGSISLGFFGYEIHLIIKDKLNHYIIESLFVILSYVAVFYYVFKYSSDEYYFFLPVIFLILIVIQMSMKKFIIPDCLFTRLLGKFSMIIFLNHFYIFLYIQNTSFASIREKVYMGLAGTLIVSIFVYAIIDTIKYLSKHIKTISN